MNSSPWTRNSVPPILWVACVTCGSWRTHSIRDRKRTSGETVSLARGDMGFQADKADSLDSIVKESEKGLKPERSPRTLRSKDRGFPYVSSELVSVRAGEGKGMLPCLVAWLSADGAPFA